MSETTTTLPGEGDTRMQVRVRRYCDECGALATRRLGFLMENYRSNPASSAYGRDDCSWSTDAEAHVCDMEYCRNAVVREYRDKGYANGTTWTLNDRFAHMFLHWVTSAVEGGR